MLKKIMDFIRNIIGNSEHNDNSKNQTFNFKGNKGPIYVSNNNIDKNVENKTKNNSKKYDDVLGVKARKILKNAVESNVFFYTDNNDDGKLFCGNLIIDLFNIGIKEKTDWIGAIEELENNGYIIGDKYNYGFYDDDCFDNSFEVTKKGFDFYENYYKNRKFSELTFDIVDEWED